MCMVSPSEVAVALQATLDTDDWHYERRGACTKRPLLLQWWGSRPNRAGRFSKIGKLMAERTIGAVPVVEMKGEGVHITHLVQSGDMMAACVHGSKKLVIIFSCVSREMVKLIEVETAAPFIMSASLFASQCDSLPALALPSEIQVFDTDNTDRKWLIHRSEFGLGDDGWKKYSWDIDFLEVFVDGNKVMLISAVGICVWRLMMRDEHLLRHTKSLLPTEFLWRIDTPLGMQISKLGDTTATMSWRYITLSVSKEGPRDSTSNVIVWDVLGKVRKNQAQVRTDILMNPFQLGRLGG